MTTTSDFAQCLRGLSVPRATSALGCQLVPIEASTAKTSDFVEKLVAVLCRRMKRFLFRTFCSESRVFFIRILRRYRCTLLCTANFAQSPESRAHYRVRIKRTQHKRRDAATTPPA